jgi:opacity protein-like surface antigen
MTRIIRVGVAGIASALALTAQAADMRVPAYRVPAATVFSWTGCYAGGQLGALGRVEQGAG